MRKAAMMMATLAAMALVATPALASKRDIKRFSFEDNFQGVTSMHTHYPGDVATRFGTYQVRGDRKIPYVERCHWTFEISDIGLPWHLKQVCRRYYGKPVK